jgi:hypothetical protein
LCTGTAPTYTRDVADIFGDRNEEINERGRRMTGRPR